MNFKESKKILEEIKKAERILVNCHRGPDSDSVGSALAVSYVLKKIGKSVDIVCPSEKIYDNVAFLKDYESIKKGVNFKNFNFSNYNLFVILDSSNLEMVFGSSKILFPKIKSIVIDHHHTSEGFGDINLIDKKASSVGEMLYLLFCDWQVGVDEDTSTALLTAIFGDTGIFKYPNASERTFEITYQLIKSGAKKDVIISNIYRNNDFNLLKFWGEALMRLVVDEEYGFVYSAIPFEVYESLGRPEYAKETAVDLFGQSTKGSDFGFMALETKKGTLSVSFRSRLGFDTSKIALALGGGGHMAASGAKVVGMSFDAAVEKVVGVARKYAKKNR